MNFIAWALAWYPDSNFIYTSYAHALAKRQTQTVRSILNLREYKEIFGVDISSESSAKDDFSTEQGGSVYAAGAGGSITGRGAGIQNSERFGGAILIDDIHKPSEVTSDTMRDSIKEWYFNTLKSRTNSQSTPIVFIGQRLHEDDLAANLISGYDGDPWEIISLPSLDENMNALHPTMHTREQLLVMKETMPYVYASQYQQDPQPAGGGIFKEDWFPVLETEPTFIGTFITSDTAETDKTYNDATVFSFWGVYKVNEFGQETDIYALHCIDSVELWIEPKDLEGECRQFITECMRHPVKPQTIAIEKKSTGVTLVSMLKQSQGIRLIDIERNASSGSKSKRFLDVQSFAAKRLISFPIFGKHTQRFIKHLGKITANDTHRYDDMADTFTDAINMALVDKTALLDMKVDVKREAEVLRTFNQHTHQITNSRKNLW
jgi:predicted phage terminase large subunit-like protein